MIQQNKFMKKIKYKLSTIITDGCTLIECFEPLLNSIGLSLLRLISKTRIDRSRTLVKINFESRSGLSIFMLSLWMLDPQGPFLYE